MWNMKTQKNVQVATDALTALQEWVDMRKDSIDLWQAFSAAVRLFNAQDDAERLKLALDEERRQFEEKQRRLTEGATSPRRKGGRGGQASAQG